MAERRPSQTGNPWDFESLGTPGTPRMYASPLTTMATSNSLLSRSVRRGGGAACRQRSHVAVPSTSKETPGHTKAFNLPDVLVRYRTGEGDAEYTGVQSIRVQVLSLKVDPAMPWGDHYNISPFSEGTVQSRVAEKAAELYANPALSTIGGFFYRIYREKERVSSSHATLNPTLVMNT
jgi:hypothetical protein